MVILLISIKSVYNQNHSEREFFYLKPSKSCCFVETLDNLNFKFYAIHS